MSDLFICYSRTDIAIARQLTDKLETEGWTVYLDVHTQVGRRWHQVIERELHAAKAVVALWSARSRDSDFVLEEADYGRRHNILFPAFIEPVEFPYGFSRIQTADMISWKGEPDHPGLAQLLTALREHLGVGRQPFAANGAIDENRHGDADLRPVELSRHSGMDRRNPDSMDGSDPEHPCSLDSGDPCRNDDKNLNATALPIQTPPANVFIPGQTFRDPLKIGGEGPQMVVIPPGRFMMGSPPDEPERSEDEGPQHEVIIQTPFALGVCAVTFAEYDLFCQNTRRELPSDRSWGRNDRPVIYVSWHDAQDYCAWLSQQTGHGYRLPSEAEWEYVCRAGTPTPFSFGGNITPEQVNYDGNYPYAGGKKGQYRKKTIPVQSLPPNPWGLHEMHGNVWEWVQDAWHGDYNGAPTDGSSLGVCRHWRGPCGSRRVLGQRREGLPFCVPWLLRPRRLQRLRWLSLRPSSGRELRPEAKHPPGEPSGAPAIKGGGDAAGRDFLPFCIVSALSLLFIVPTLCVGMPPATLQRRRYRTAGAVKAAFPRGSVGTINDGIYGYATALSLTFPIHPAAASNSSTPISRISKPIFAQYFFSLLVGDLFNTQPLGSAAL